MIRRKLLFFLLSISALCNIRHLHSAIVDNRWLPLIWRPFITEDDRPSHIRPEFFALTGKRAYDNHKDEILLPAIYGSYDQGDLARAMVKLGYPNPLKPEWQGASIPWRIGGKLQGQGFTFSYQQSITNWLSVGFYSYLLHLESWHEFFLDMDKISLRLQAGDLLELDEIRRSMHSQIGLCGDHAHHTGIGDVDIYLKLGHSWNYALKFKRIDAGLRLGVLCPAACQRNSHYPASIPFGGEKQWGVYGALEAEFELKEDWKAGLFAWVGKRINCSGLQQRRIPLCCEPQPYGAACGPVSISQGVTCALSPYFSLENLRDGFGLRAQYTLRYHAQDTWASALGVSNFPKCSLNVLEQVNKRSSWGSDYFSVSAFYDFGKINMDRAQYPIVSLSWDIPAAVFVADSSAKTQQIALGIEWNY